MKILMSTDTVGGVWNYALRLISGLASYGVHVSLATMGRSLNHAQWREIESLDNVSVFESRYRLEWMQQPWDDVDAAGEWLLDIERTTAPDVIHLNHYTHGNLPWRAPSLVVGHSCVCSWISAVRGMSPGTKWEEYRRRVTDGLHATTAVVAPTREMLDQLRYWYGITDGDVIPNSHQGSSCGQAPRLRTSREPYLLSAGRIWDEAKNIQLLAEIAGEVRVPIRVAGESDHPDELGSSEMGSLEILGQLSQTELRTQMHNASLFVHPAKYEPFGLAPLEAALCGCPLILADIASLREIWGSAAIYLDPNSPRDWLKLLNRLIDDQAAREGLGKASMKRAQQYTIDRMTERYTRLYRHLIMTFDAQETPLEPTR